MMLKDVNLLINEHYTFKNVQIIFKLKNRFTCDSLHLIYVVICGTCKEECIGETREGKTKLRDRVRVYRQHIWQPQYQQLKVDGHLSMSLRGISDLSFATNVFTRYKLKWKL